jgi:hypothetical protein
MPMVIRNPAHDADEFAHWEIQSGAGTRFFRVAGSKG